MAVEQKVKLLCSFGGRILPRPVDGALRYFGGETRIISVARGISFADFMIKVSAACGGAGAAGAAALRYQLPDEDLDALVSVSSPDDLANMIDEYDKLAASSSPGASPKLRAFLFSDPPSGSKARADDSASTPRSASSPRVEAASNPSSPLLQAVDPAWPEAPMDCVEAQSVQYMNSGVAGGAQAISGLPASQFSNLKPVEVYPYGVSAVQPVPRLSPLPVGYFRPQFEQLGRFEDCLMCHKALPHAHSDTLVPERGDGSPVCTPRTSPVFYSHRPENMPMRAPFPQVAQYDMERLALQKREDLASPGVWLPPDSMGPLVDGLSPRMVILGSNQQSGFVDPWPQHLLLNQQPNLGPPQYHVEQEPIAATLAVNANYPSSVADENLLVAQPGTVPESSYNYVGQMDGMMGALRRISPVETAGFNEQWRAVVQPSVGTPMELKPSTSPLAVEHNYNIRPQIGGTGIFCGGGGIVPDGSHLVKPIDRVPPAYVNVAPLRNLQPVATGPEFYMMGSHDPFPLNLGTGFEPPAPSDKLLGIPAHSYVVNPAHTNRVVGKTNAADRGDEASQLCSKNMLNYIPGLYPLTNTMSPDVLTAPIQELSSPDSLFCNEDPWKVLGGTQLLPQRPSKVNAKEPAISCINNQLRYRNASDMIALLEEGVLHPLPDLAAKDLRPDQVQQTKEELQDLTEVLAASALPSAVIRIPSLANETEEHVDKINKGRETKDDIGEINGATTLAVKEDEDTMAKLSDNATQNLQVSEEFGHLQVIKNSDLEELRELGSGTFGTVYHGKWRGSDVAIKRINERCFTGKASEQERMRNDFWNEACKLSELHHPNVVAFYGVVLDGPGGSIATVTEYMVNGSLRNALQKNEKTFGHRKRLLVAMDVAFGMEYLHEKKIVHFDLKSDNLLVNLRDPQRPICKVGDLGLSKVKCKTLISGGVRGTLPWMAPELLNGSSSLVSEKVDVFSFGIVMWELLTGEEPYADLHYGAIIGGILSNTLRPPVPESCDPEWRSLMEGCWSSEPSERPSFTEVADSLRSIAARLELKSSHRDDTICPKMPTKINLPR